MGNLSERDFDTYMELFEQMMQIVRLPDLMIYLRASVPHLIANIQKRGRDYEQTMQLDYLENLNTRYEPRSSAALWTVSMPNSSDYLTHPQPLPKGGESENL